MWKNKLQEIAQEKKTYGEELNVGATNDEITEFLVEFRNQLNVDLPEGYTRFLETVNGLEFNGFVLYGIDSCLLKMQPNQTIYGLIENNKIWYENEWQKKYIFLGEGNISWYVYDLANGKYYELDNPSGRETEAFNRIEDLLEKILKDALA